jgi:hypothetical protein
VNGDVAGVGAAVLVKLYGDAEHHLVLKAEGEPAGDRQRLVATLAVTTPRSVRPCPT